MKQIIILSIFIAAIIACGTKPQTGEVSDKTVFVITTPDTMLADTHWKLVQLSGNPVPAAAVSDKELFLFLKKEGNIVNGFSGCNTFAGTYELKGDAGLKFSQLTSTLMACEDMEMEKQVTSMLANVGSYDIHGDTLFLHQTPPTPIARYEVANQ